MSENVLLFSDLHVHTHKKSTARLEHCIDALNWVFDVAEQNNIKHILFGGDLFHDREKIEIYTYQRTFDTLKQRLKGINLYLLLGNHDLWYHEKTSVSSVIPLSTLPGVKVIAEPERLNIAGCNWDFIPYTHNPLESLELLKTKSGNAEYALGHIAVDGAMLHKNQYSDVIIEHDGEMVSITPSLFNDYKHTFLGHYHAEQRVNNKVEYIGSPLEFTFGEAFQEKHIIIFNGKTGYKEYVVNDFSPKHLILNQEEISKHDLTNCFVQIKIDDMGSTDLLEMRKDILQNNAIASLEIKKQKKPMEQHVINDAKAILYKGDEMLAKYVDEVGSKELDRTLLIDIGKKICQKTTS